MDKIIERRTKRVEKKIHEKRQGWKLLKIFPPKNENDSLSYDIEVQHSCGKTYIYNRRYFFGRLFSGCTCEKTNRPKKPVNHKTLTLDELKAKRIKSVQKRIDTKRPDWELVDLIIDNETVTGGNYELIVRHKDCGLIQNFKSIYFFNHLFKGCACSGKSVVRHDITTAQQQIDEVFGIGRLELLSFQNVKEQSLIKCNMCGHEFNAIQTNLLKNKNGCPNCKFLQRITLDNYITEKINALYEGKLLYVRNFKSLRKSAIFKIAECGHEIEMNGYQAINRRSVPICPICGKGGQPVTGCIISDKRFDSRESIKPKTAELQRLEDIANNLLDLVIYKKTKSLHPKLKENMDFLIDFQKFYITHYDIPNNINDHLRDDLSRADIPLVKRTPFLNKKMYLNFDNLECDIQTSKLTIHSALLIQVDNFGMDNIMSVSYRNSKEEKCALFIMKNGILLTPNTQVEKRLNVYIYRILDVLSRVNVNMPVRDYYSSKKIYCTYDNELTNNVNGIIEYKKLIYDLKRQKYNIIHKGHSNRKISCNFNVTGHYRHYKTGDSTFIEEFEKGVEFKHIRKIEKGYTVK